MKTLLLTSMIFASLSYGTTYGANANDDGEKIVGSWKIESARKGGQKPAGDAYTYITIVITPEKLTMNVADKPIAEMKYKLDAKHGWIDLTDVKSQGKHVSHGIYKLEGNELKICYPESSSERSTAFESKPNSANDVLWVLNRDKS